ncbi:MAG: glycosyltransferase family 4 protein [Dehalococcoidia bacterium]|nr:glycosyltransferase family 4 protein [Dehalococcoidia bacterium]
MRIAIVAPPWFAVPPKGYGGIEQVVSYLADGLVDRGHVVTLFASGGSCTRAELAVHFDDPPSASLGDPLMEARHLLLAYSRWDEFDVIHDHTRLGVVAGCSARVPVVHTMHGQVTPEYALYYRAAVEAGIHLVGISERQRSYLPPGVHADVIGNALDLKQHPFRDTPGDYLLFVGRMNPEKGIVQAIEIARRAGMPLRISSKVNEPQEREYFEAMVRPLLEDSPGAEFLGEVSREPLKELFAGAYATLCPVNWEEPFGLVMIESMATGTPVIGFRRGSVPEVVDNGVTGFVVDDVDGALAAVPRIRELDRTAGRQRVRELFSAPVAVAKHEALYERLIATHTARARGDTDTMGESLSR